MREKTALYIRGFLFSQEAFNYASDKKEALKVLRRAELRMLSAFQNSPGDNHLIPELLLTSIHLS